MAQHQHGGGVNTHSSSSAAAEDNNGDEISPASAAAEREEELVESLLGLVGEIGRMGGSEKLCFPPPLNRKECGSFMRRILLLAPLFEELRDFLMASTPPDAVAAACRPLLPDLAAAIHKAKEMLLLLSHPSTSKIRLVLEEKRITYEFHEVISQLEHSLGRMPYSQLNISDEVCEQVELVLSQLKRAKERNGSLLDSELCADLFAIQTEPETDQKVLSRLADKLQLTTISTIEQEFKAFQTFIAEGNGNTIENHDVERMMLRLQSLKDSNDPQLDKASAAKNASSPEKKPADVVIIPDDFRCPISLELMRDPVIVATGQTYERSCIQRWIDSGHKTCPKTQQTLPHLALIPNYVLRSLIAQWCEAHGVEQPKNSGCSRSRKSCGGLAEEVPGDRAAIDNLVQLLSDGSPEEQRGASEELRLLAKRNTDNRVCIAEAGAIPLLVNLMSTKDLRTQEHTVTAILNLSIYDNNKGAIVMAGAIPHVVEVLKSGSMEARENAAATLFSLSLMDENKVTIGSSGAISALIQLLCEGSARGKKDAATALFNLCIYQGNKARAVRAGIMDPLMKLLADPNSGMVDEALAILAVLASHHDGKVAIGRSNAIPVLIDLLRTGLARNKENAAAILLALCKKNPEHLKTLQRLGGFIPLSELVKNGTERAKRKAGYLLEHMSRLDQMWEENVKGRRHSS
ncbi:hypothetical protein AMTRI_Chr01g114970 [Amborella trichopoda]